MLEVGPEGFESVLLTYATVWDIWEFIMGEVFINRKGALTGKLGGCVFENMLVWPFWLIVLSLFFPDIVSVEGNLFPGCFFFYIFVFFKNF